MYVKYRGILSGLNECRVRFTRQRNYESVGIVKVASSETHRCVIAGRLHGTDISNLLTQYTVVQSTYSVDGGDFYFLGNDASTVVRSFISSGTINGVRVTGPPDLSADDTAGQLTTFLDYDVTLEADYQIAQTATGKSLVASAETLEISGDGGPDVVWRKPLVGPPIQFQVRQQTTIEAVQSGYAEGYGDYPRPARPLYPNYLLRSPKPRIREVPPARNAAGSTANRKYRIEWTYYFEFAASVSTRSF